jgi:geranylgeranylglycerol-phosphate geranylgeranyltransferase
MTTSYSQEDAGYQEKTLGFVRLLRPRLTVGYAIAGLAGLFVGFSGAVDLSSAVHALLTIFCATAGIYMLNDVFDLENDLINDPERPIPSGLVSKRVASTASIILMGISLLLGYFASVTTFFLTSFLVLVGVAYSVPPVRLRRFFLVPNFCLAVLGSFAFLVGGSLGNASFTGVLVVGIVMFAYTVPGSFAKEFKDIEGDAATGIKTLPMIVRKKTAAKIAGLSITVGCAFFLVPYFLIDLNIIYLVSMSLVLVFTAVYSLEFSRGGVSQEEGRKFYDRGVLTSLSFPLLLILGSL